MDIEELKVKQSLEMMQSDFEQRSQQVIQLSLDRSKFVRLSLLVWAFPLVIVASLLKKETGISSFSWDLYIRLIVGGSFLVTSMIGCVLLSALINNTNSANLAASGLNYLRTIYFSIMIENSIINLDSNLKKVLFLDTESKPILKIIRSDSASLSFIFISIINILYGAFGLVLLSKPTYILVSSIMIFTMIILSHIFLFHKSRFKGLD